MKHNNTYLIILCGTLLSYSFSMQAVMRSQSSKKNDFDYLYENALTLTNDQIVHYLQEKFDKARFNPFINTEAVSKNLLYNCNEKMSYHKPRINHKHDYDTIALGVGLTAVGSLCALASYLIYKKWHQHYNNQIDNLTGELTKKGIKVSERMVSFGNNSTTYIDFEVPHNVSYGYAKNSQTELVSLRGSKELAISIELLTMCGALCSWFYGISGIIAGLSPKHKEQYEKLLFIKETVERLRNTSSSRSNLKQ